VRTRKEIRDLCDEAWNQVVSAIWIMKNTSLTDGQGLYGSAFKPYDYFVVKHAVASDDTRGDQGHFGPPFMTFHRLIMAEMENAFLAVVNGKYGSSALVDAWPYWDPSLDSPTGKYFSSVTRGTTNMQNAFSNKYFGGYDGDPNANYTVTDGAFAGWSIGQYASTHIDPAFYNSSRCSDTPSANNSYRGCGNFVGNLNTGQLRGGVDTSRVLGLKRFPTVASTQLDDEQYFMWDNDDFLMCTNASVVQSHMQWQACNNNAMYVGKTMGPGLTAEESARGLSTKSNIVVGAFNIGSGTKGGAPNTANSTLGYDAPHWIHTQAHVKVGSYQGNILLVPVPTPVATSIGISPPPPFTLICNYDEGITIDGTYYGCPGDMTDIATSPNDPMFVFFHMNLDRMNLEWLDNFDWYNKDFNSIAYPTKTFEEWWPTAHINNVSDVDPGIAWNIAAREYGTLFTDIVNWNYGFRKGILYNGVVNEGSSDTYYTHQDVWQATYDGLPYRYERSSVYGGGCSAPCTGYNASIPPVTMARYITNAQVACGAPGATLFAETLGSSASCGAGYESARIPNLISGTLPPPSNCSRTSAPTATLCSTATMPICSASDFCSCGPAPSPVTPTPTLVPVPVSLTQTVTFSLSASQYVGVTKSAYDSGYASFLGIYESATSTLKAGCSLTGALSSRRGGASVAYTASVIQALLSAAYTAANSQTAANDLQQAIATIISSHYPNQNIPAAVVIHITKASVAAGSVSDGYAGLDQSISFSSTVAYSSDASTQAAYNKGYGQFLGLYHTSSFGGSWTGGGVTGIQTSRRSGNIIHFFTVLSCSAYANAYAAATTASGSALQTAIQAVISAEYHFLSTAIKPSVLSEPGVNAGSCGFSYSPNNNGLDGGAIAGIVVGSIVGAVLCATIIYFTVIRGKKDECHEEAPKETHKTTSQSKEETTIAAKPSETSNDKVMHDSTVQI